MYWECESNVNLSEYLLSLIFIKLPGTMTMTMTMTIFFFTNLTFQQKPLIIRSSAELSLFWFIAFCYVYFRLSDPTATLSARGVEWRIPGMISRIKRVLRSVAVVKSNLLLRTSFLPYTCLPTHLNYTRTNRFDSTTHTSIVTHVCNEFLNKSESESE